MTSGYRCYSGAGNTFLIFDNRHGDFPCHLASSLCLKENMDGVVLLEDSGMANFKMRILNSDGSESAMCGNGLRCFIRFLDDIGESREHYQIETEAGLYYAWKEEDQVIVKMLPPSQMKWDIEENVHFLNTGVPHCVVFVENIDEVPIRTLGPKFRYHPLFSPQGANVNFVSVENCHSIKIRTYERGVEDETLACGTGSVASTIAGFMRAGLKSPVTVHLRSQETIEISFTPDFSNIEMKGPVSFLKPGSFSLNDKTSIIPAYD